MDLSKLSNEDLLALRQGNLSKMSDEGLRLVKGAPAPAPAPTYDPTEGMSTFDKAAAGAGKAVADTGRGLGQMLGLVSREDVAEARKRDAALMDTGAGMGGNIAGSLAMALAPGGALLGAGKAASKAPGAARLAELLMAGGKTMLAPASIPGAAAVGALQGAIQPSTSTGETLANTGLGAAASAALPLAIRGGQMAKAAIDPFSRAGQQKIVGSAIREATGGQADEAIRALQAAAPLVPGSLPTAGQAAQNPGIAALERTAVQTDPVAMNQMAQRLAAQNDARLGALRDIAGTDGKREFFAANRDATANQLYGNARRAGVDPAALTPEAQANIAAFQQRLPDEVVAEARKLAKINGEPLDNTTSVQGLHWIKKGLDSLIAREAGPNGSRDFLRAYTGLKNDLVAGLDNMSPAYAEASKTYAAMSRPINQMDLAAELLKKSVRPIDDQIMPGQYARQLGDDLAAKTTGIRSATLEKVLEPEQLATMNAVRDDLARANFANTAGRGVGSDTVQKLAYSNLMSKSGLPGFFKDLPGAGVVGRAADIGYKRSNDEMRQMLAQALLDPQQTAALMQSGALTPEMLALIEAIKRGGAGLGATAPYLLNSAKE